MLLIPTYLAPSAVHGVGVFAAEDIPQGTLLWQFVPGLDLVIPAEMLASYPAEARKYVEEYGYEDQYRPGAVVLSGDNARFINHSHTPNTYSEKDEAFALRDIAKGEEITCNYLELNPAYSSLPYVGEAPENVLPYNSLNRAARK